MKKILFLFTLIFLISCQDTEDKFMGIWMGDTINFYNPEQENFKKEIENKSLTQGYPILLDFQKNNTLTLKVFGKKTHENITWKVEKDSILNVNNTRYRIQKITKDTICLDLSTRADNYEYKIYRIKNKKINLDSISVINKLTANIWSNLKEDSQKARNLQYENHLEYFHNNIRLLKYSVPPHVYGTKDSTVNIQIDRWGIGEYKGYYFISNCDDQLIGTLPYFNIFQITKINDAELKIFRPQWFNQKQAEFYTLKKPLNTSITEHKLIGLWKSNNSKEKSYSYYQRTVKESEKYQGDLFYHFDSKKLLKYGIKTDTLMCNWFLNKDKTVLFYEYPYEFEYFKGITVYASRIKDFDNNFLELNEFESSIYSYQKRYLLNINQKFQKIKNH